MLFESELFDRARCSSLDKGAAARLVPTLYLMAEQARKEGLLSLEADIDLIEDEFLRWALPLVINGVDPEAVRELLVTRMYSYNYSGAQLLKAMIVSDGVLAIQAGENPSLTRVRLENYLGPDAEVYRDQPS